MPTYNPDGADEALYKRASEDAPRILFGQWNVNMWECVLVKGVGKVPYNPIEHAGERTSVAIDIIFTPLNSTQKVIKKNTLDWSPDWREVTRESTKVLAPQIAEVIGKPPGQFVPVLAANGLFAKAELVMKPDNESGETWTCFKLLAFYRDQSACAAASDAWRKEQGRDGEGVKSNTPSAIAQMGTVATAPPKLPDERATMSNFLMPTWLQAGGMLKMTGDAKDAAMKEMGSLIASNPMLADHFDIESPEVQAILSAVEEEIPF